MFEELPPGIVLRNAKWKLGTPLRKKSGSSWRGKVVGFYSTSLTPNGYCIESENEPGSVQLYPESALEEVLVEDFDPKQEVVNRAVEYIGNVKLYGASASTHQGRLLREAVEAYEQTP